MALTDKLKSIADAIRDKAGTSETMTLDEMPDKIAAIQSGGGAKEPYVEETYDDNGDLIAAKMVGHTAIRSLCYYSSPLKNIDIPSTVTRIEKSAFERCSNLESLILPLTITEVGQSAFATCTALKTVNLSALRNANLGSHIFSGSTQFDCTELPDEWTTIPQSMFRGTDLSSLIKLPDSLIEIGQDAFYSSKISVTKLPPNLITIGGSAFRSSKLTTLEIPASVETIENYVFASCYQLRTVEFKGTPKSIGNNAFYSSSNLTTINVPWAEDAVADAPWGATNATINYNYTGTES